MIFDSRDETAFVIIVAADIFVDFSNLLRYPLF